MRTDATVTSDRGSGAKLRIHRTRTLDDEDVTTRHGIPVTTPARTLVDLASVLQPDALAKALNEAEHQRLFDLTAIERTMARARTRRGAGHARLRDALDELRQHGPTLTRSSLEDAFLQLVKDAGLPRPVANAHVEGHEVDAYWPSRKLVVELDGWKHHGSRHAFHHDRGKANDLTAKGCTVLRYTHRALTREPHRIERQLRALLS